MSLRGYIKKGKPAPWTRAFPSQVTAPKPRAQKQRSPGRRIRNESRSRAAEQRLYREMAKDFIACHPAWAECPVASTIPELRDGHKYGHRINRRITEVHHRFGRRGKLLLERRWFLGVSRLGHRWIHMHPEEAQKRGWIGPPGTWNDYERARKHAETLDNKG